MGYGQQGASGTGKGTIHEEYAWVLAHGVGLLGKKNPFIGNNDGVIDFSMNREAITSSFTEHFSILLKQST